VCLRQTFHELGIESRVPIATLAAFFVGNPDIRSWINFFDEPITAHSMLEPYRALPSETDDANRVRLGANEAGWMRSYSQRTHARCLGYCV
jgi:hypothetical protein